MLYTLPKPPVSTENCGPFTLTPRLQRLAHTLTDHLNNKMEKAHALYEYLNDNLKLQAKVDRPLRNAEQTFRHGGNCAEQTFLYVAMAREIGLEAGLSTVFVDHNGRDYRTGEIGHACAHVHLPPSVHVDLRYREFNVKPHKYRFEPDDYVYELFNAHAEQDYDYKPTRPKIHFLKIITLITALASGAAGAQQLYELTQRNHIPQKTYRMIKRILD